MNAETTPVWDFASVLANSVHDMKNSLSLLINNIESSLGPCTNASCDKHATMTGLGFEAKRINNQLVQLLALYRLEQKQLFLQVEETDVEEHLQEIILQHMELFTAKGLSLELACEPGLRWFYDSNMIGGVLNNVINNAFRYARNRILVSATADTDFLTIKVSDDGSGYPPAMIEMAGLNAGCLNFNNGSTGLGLFFAQQVASMHRNHSRQGRILLQNGPPLGGNFVLQLP